MKKTPTKKSYYGKSRIADDGIVRESELSDTILTAHIEQVEQRITNLKQSMNAELDSLLSVLQHMKEFVHNTKLEPSKRSGSLTKYQSEVQPEAWEHIPDVMQVKDIQSILGIGTNQAYNLVKSGVFHHIHIGNRILIPKPGFIAWLEGESQQ
ncbi:helix-turn-helix domain-containing protein [Paenibacillus sp. NPDC057934]|uniref:helix-turn-helix domain-containing protein n=1 Tax=Paenibacillus sp. NPDC057934 TaxID=3346282 RepID=UPI0036DA527E